MQKSLHVIVAGGTGNIGEGIVRSALRSGATVVVPSRSRARLNALERYIAHAGVKSGSLRTVEADVGSFDGARDFIAATLKELGLIHLSVASLGGWCSGPPLLESSESAYRAVMTSNLDAHYTFARHVLPSMRESGGIHVLIGGPSTVLYNSPSTLITIAGHAQLAMAQALDREVRSIGARAYQLFVAHVYDRQRGTEIGNAVAQSGVITPDQIGERILEIYRDRPARTVHKLFAQPIPGFLL